MEGSKKLWFISHLKNQTGDEAMETPVIMAGQEGRLVRQAENDSQLIELWIHGKTTNTAEAYRRDIDRFTAFVNKPLPQVTLADVQAFSDSLGAELADASKARMLAAVKSLLTFGHRVGYLLFNVGAAIELPKVKNTLAERFLDKRSTRLMIDREPNPRNQALLRLIYIAGLRVSEATNLAGKDLTPREKGGQVTVFGKGGKTRMLLIDEVTWNQLMTLRSESTLGDSPIFQTRSGKALHRMHVLKIVKAAAKRAGIKKAVSPHWLRHATATHMITDGAPIHEVQAQLGHASISTTGKYLHALPINGAANYLAW